MRRRLCFFGLLCCCIGMLWCIVRRERPNTLGDRPLGPKIHFGTIYYPEGQPRHFGIEGTLGGEGQLSLDPNHLTLDSHGKIQGTTLLGFDPIKVRLEAIDMADPDGLGRRFYNIVSGGGGHKRTYSLVLSPNEAGVHRLLIREGEKLVATHVLTDPERDEQLAMEPKLAKASAEDKAAVAGLRNAVGCSFRFHIDTANTINFLYFPDADDITALDPALSGFKNVTLLYFRGGRMGGVGLKCLRQMPALRTLSISDSDIEDGSLVCLKDATQIEGMSFSGCRGISDKGVENFRGLTNLKSLDLRNERFTEREPKAPRITDAGLAHLAGLTKLEYLNLMGHPITDDGLRYLSGMAGLRTLAVSFSGITDAGLKHLEGLANLRDLHLYGTKVTPAGRAALRAKLPNLKLQ